MRTYNELEILIQATKQALSSIPNNATELSESIKSRLVGKTISNTVELDFIAKAVQCADDLTYLESKMDSFEQRRKTLSLVLLDLQKKQALLSDNLIREICPELFD
jgi:hypothetical protein